MSVVVRYRGKVSDYHVNIPFRNCKADDFKKRGLKGNEINFLHYEKTNFCPEFDKY